MIFWVDAQFSPLVAAWLTARFSVEAYAVKDLGLRDAEDVVIFDAARDVSAVVISKDKDFVRLVEQRGSPPQVLWITCGNTSNARLREILEATFSEALRLLQAGERLVEISDV